MKYITVTAGLSLAFILIAAANSVSAQEDDSGHMFSLIEVTVSPGHEDKFREGVAAWKNCYLENDGSSNWNVWRRMHGKGTSYAVAFSMAGWADLDETDEAGQACRDVVTEQITPHTDSGKSSYIQFMPEVSKAPSENDVIWVTSFRVSDGRTFRQVVESVVESIRKAEGEPRGYWYDVLGGSAHDADLMVVTPYENFAALDVERKEIWAVVAENLGEEEAERLRTDSMDSLDAVWGYLYRRVGELSHPPED